MRANFSNTSINSQLSIFDDLILIKNERKNRELTYNYIKLYCDGDDDAIKMIPPHSCSLLSYSSHDLTLLHRFTSRLDDHNENFLSLLGSFYVQMQMYGKAYRIFQKLRTIRNLTQLEYFLMFKSALLSKENVYTNFLMDFDFDLVRDLHEKYPQVSFDLLSRYVKNNGLNFFIKESKDWGLREDVVCLLNTAYQFAKNNPYSSNLSNSFSSHLNYNNVVAVYGMRCSGGSALQDFLTDHKDLATSRGEYLVFSGAFGVRTLNYNVKNIPYLFYEFIRHHFLSLTVPINRSFSRIARQPVFDINNNIFDTHIATINFSFNSTSIKESIFKILQGTWSTYLNNRKCLLLKKLFSSGNFELLADLPPLKGIMVWRDPRDQYVDQVQRGFVKQGDVFTFIDQFIAKVNRLKSSLLSASEQHRDAFINIGFEEFVYSESYRANIRNLLGLSANNYTMNKFNPTISLNNIGIWRNYVYLSDIKIIEEKLNKYLNSSRSNPYI